jgi:hypothetical protein
MWPACVCRACFAASPNPGPPAGDLSNGKGRWWLWLIHRPLKTCVQYYIPCLCFTLCALLHTPQDERKEHLVLERPAPPATIHPVVCLALSLDLKQKATPKVRSRWSVRQLNNNNAQLARWVRSTGTALPNTNPETKISPYKWLALPPQAAALHQVLKYASQPAHFLETKWSVANRAKRLPFSRLRARALRPRPRPAHTLNPAPTPDAPPAHLCRPTL